MPISLIIFFITTGIITYIFLGIFIDKAIELCMHYKNPLWKPIIIAFWPFAKLYLLMYLIAKWILSVIEYYKEKKK